MTDKKTIFQEHFLTPVEKTGKYTLLAAIVCMFLPGLFLFVFHGLLPPFGPLWRSVAAVWSFMIVMGILEPIVYYPILGFGGTYMSFLVGNIMNLRVPVSATVQQVLGTREGTPEAEIVSTLGIAGSLVASQLVMILGILLLLPLINRIQGSGMAAEVGLNQVLPALFGALGAVFLSKVPKLGIVPLGLAFIIAFLKRDLPYSVVIPPMVIISIVSARIMYKKKWIEGKGMI
ncbi:hypothetical protein KKI24_05535 [bacterium]|nr:hypothetical protein [bacterium]